MTVIKIKNSNVSGRLPASGDIETAELAINIADKKLYSKDAAGAIFEIGVAGDIPSGITPPSSGNNNGDLYFDTSTNRLLYWDGSGWQTVVKANGDNFTGDVTLNTDKITLDATTGGATFAGKVTTASTVAGDAATTVVTKDYLETTGGTGGEGFVEVSGDNMTGDLTLGNGTDDKITLDATAGTASFAGDVTVAGTGSVTLDTYGGGLFTGTVTAESNATAFFKRNYVGTVPELVGSFVTQYNGADTAVIFTDGSATFAGLVEVGNYNSGDSSSGGVVAKPSGQLVVQAQAGSKESPTTAVQGNETASDGKMTGSWYIRSDGNASFKSTVTASNVTFNLEADDDTKYTSTTDSEGVETRVYNGEVLDVKDRLTKADNALKALKTAAAAATTIADLKNAITTALADV